MSNYPTNHEVYESTCLNCDEDLYSSIGYQDYCNSWCRYEHRLRIQREKSDKKEQEEQEEQEEKKQKNPKK